MVNELTALYNTLMRVETKGESTILMAQCVNYTKQLISKCANEQKAEAEKASEEGDK